MPSGKSRKAIIEKLPKIILFFIIVLGTLLTYYPHLNYPFPLYVDEWYHIYVARYVSQVWQPPQLDIYMRRFPLADPELGFHYMLALLYPMVGQSITNWMYLPVIVDALAILSVFYFVSKLFDQKTALVSSLLVALIPTNVTIGGPVFLIPVNLGLVLIPLALVFAFELVKMKPLSNYACFFVLATLLLYTHPPSAMVLLLIIGFYILLNLKSKDKEERKSTKYLFIATMLAIVASLPLYIPYIQLKSGVVNAISFSFSILVSDVAYVYGVLQTIFFMIGIYIIANTHIIENKEKWSLLFASVALILIIVIFANFNINLLIPYQRVYIPLFLLMSIIAGAGYAALLNIDVSGAKLGMAMVLIFLLASAIFSIQKNLSTPYYHIINPQDYKNFIWIRNTFNGNSTALLDPWKAKAFGPITGMRVYSVIPFGPDQRVLYLVNKTYTFLNSNCVNTQLLMQNNISIVYTDKKCTNSILAKVNSTAYNLTGVNVTTYAVNLNSTTH